ncbi:hypothetical protein ACWGJ2_11660 [Streptomyces sp. NPDC054796]
MAEPHCSKCCPVKPPKPDAPEPIPSQAAAWLLLIVVLVLGGYAGLMYVASQVFA